eukprot:m.40634 g.40634  ORF g.40634 m.40634 type:complete len:172 (-) comp6937_c0_seq1:58-573(-)
MNENLFESPYASHVFGETTLVCDVILRWFFLFPLHAAGLRGSYPGDPWFKPVELKLKIVQPPGEEDEEGDADNRRVSTKIYADEFLVRRINMLCGAESVACLSCCLGGCCKHIPLVVKVKYESSTGKLSVFTLPERSAHVLHILLTELSDLHGNRIHLENQIPIDSARELL